MTTNPTETQVRAVIASLMSRGNDEITNNPTILWDVGRELAVLLTSLSPDLVRSKRLYWRKLGEMRRREGIKTKADAEILAMDTDEWEGYENMRLLYDNGQETLYIVKKYMGILSDEMRNSRYLP